jgi:hypothetical protein
MCVRITQKCNPHVLGLKIATLIEPLPNKPDNDDSSLLERAS